MGSSLAISDMPFTSRPQVVLPATALAIGAGLMLLSIGEAPHGLLRQLLELYENLAGQTEAETALYAAPPIWGPLLQAAGLLVTGGLALYGLNTGRRRLTIAISAVGLIALWSATWFLYSTDQILIDPIYPSLTLAIALALYWIAGQARQELSRRQVRSAFGRQLSPQRTNLLAATEGRSYTSGERKTVTVLSCRILDVKTHYAALEDDPDKLIRLFKEFLRRSTEVVRDFEGTVVPNAGDRLTAFWNAPLDDPEHARHACLSALEITDKIKQLNERIQANASRSSSLPPLGIGIGIDTGPAFVGALQSGQRIGYAALGDTVDQAARLQRQTVNYGTSIIVGQETRRFVTDLPLLELDRVVLKSQDESTKIYSLLEPHLVPSENAFQAHQLLHNAMIHAYRHQHWEEATSYLVRCHAYCDELERLYAIYASRIDYYGSAPPGASWDGSVVAADG